MRPIVGCCWLLDGVDDEGARVRFGAVISNKAACVFAPHPTHTDTHSKHFPIKDLTQVSIVNTNAKRVGVFV